MLKSVKPLSKRSPLGPLYLLAFINLYLFSLLSIKADSFDYKPLMLGFALTFLAFLTHFLLHHFKMGDFYICAIVSMLVSLGLMMQFRLSPEVGLKQFMWFLIGTVVFLASNMIYAHVHGKLRSIWLFYGLIIILFILTLTLGTKVNGARNWIVFLGFSIQPSEFIKILFIFFMAEYVSSPNQLRIQFKGVHIHPKWVLMGLVFILIGFFAIQRELGTALLIFMVYLSFLYIFERDILFPIGNTLLAAGGAIIATQVVHHVQVRIDTWINPWLDIEGKGYQITQSLFAIGSGGFYGTGIGLGHPLFIPAVTTDFIFAAICEETGIFGGIAIILLFFLLVYRGIKIALRLKDRFSKAIALGLTITIGYQAFIIIGGVIKLIPLTGITLPFVSYGGSSLITSYISLGLLQSLSGPILRKEVLSHENEFHQ